MIRKLQKKRRDRDISEVPLICVGRISGPQGLKGEVHLKSYTDDPEAIAEYGPLRTEAGSSVTITRLRPVKGGFAARLEGVNSRDASEALGKTDLFVPRDRLPETQDEEYYHSDLIDLEVRSEAGDVIGTVRAVQDFGGGTLLEIFRPGAGDTALVAFTAEMVPVVDITGGIVVVSPLALEDKESR